MRADVKDLTGQKFGKLEVLSYAKGTTSATFWNVRCACGKEYQVNGAYLKDGRSTQCFDCANKERTNWERKKDPKFYRKWESMISRWKKEGMIDKRWLDFQAFRQDTYPTYQDGYRLERIDKTLPFGPENTNWIVPHTYKPGRGSDKVEIVKREKA